MEMTERVASPVEDFTYEMVDGEVVITGYTGVAREIYIPEEINDRPVTQIGEKAFAEYDLILVDIPESVTIIHEGAFEECDCLEEIRLPSGLQRIEATAFGYCDHLINVDLPDGLEFLGYHAFGSCDKLEKLVLPADFTGFDIQRALLSVEVTENGRNETWGDKISNPVGGDTVLVVQRGSEALSLIQQYGYGKIAYEIVQPTTESGIEYMESDEYLSAIVITGYSGEEKTVIIPDVIDGKQVMEVDESAFSGTAITEVYIPSGVIEIHSCAFQNCPELKKVTFGGDGEVKIGLNSFADCPKLEKLELPAGAWFTHPYGEQVWDDEEGVFAYITTGAAWPVKTTDNTILVVDKNSEAYEDLASEYNNGEIRFEVK